MKTKIRTHLSLPIPCLLLFILSFTVVGCTKMSSGNARDVRRMNENQQRKFLQNELRTNINISGDVFYAFLPQIQSEAFNLLSLKNRGMIWDYKIDMLYHAASQTNQKYHLNKVKALIRRYFFELDTTGIYASSTALVHEGKSIFGQSQYASIAGTYLLEENDILSIVGGGEVPERGACKCSTLSPFCPRNLKCIAPKLYCDENSDMFCGFLLLFSCDGLCLDGPKNSFE